ncbi:MAG: molecular chaperone DnaK, partial [Gammaproteobacteria bacterium]
NLVHGTQKSLEELGEKVDGAERTDIEAAINEVLEAVKTDDKEVIDTKSAKLGELSGKLAERVYQEAAQGAEGAADGAPEAAAGGDDVVDAEFEEVSDEKK